MSTKDSGPAVAMILIVEITDTRNVKIQTKVMILVRRVLETAVAIDSGERSP